MALGSAGPVGAGELDAAVRRRARWRRVGTQDVGAEKFRELRQVVTGSWLGQAFHGQGIGTEMRAAVLHFAFVELGAVDAVTAAFLDNAPSNAISRHLGYRPDGIDRVVRRGQPVTEQRYRLTREQWRERSATPVTVDGMSEALLAMLGAA